MTSIVQLVVVETEWQHKPDCSYPRVLQGSWLLVEDRVPEYVSEC